MLSILDNMSDIDEECSGESKEDLKVRFHLFLSTWKFREKDIDRYMKYMLRLKSGFICSICDMY